MLAALAAAESGNLQRAAELLSLVSHHPRGLKGWLKQWPLLARLHTELASALGPSAFADAWGEGKHWDLMITAYTVAADLT